MIIRSRAHLWDKTGKHMGWQCNRKSFGEEQKEQFGLQCTGRTVQRVYDDEKAKYNDGKGFRERPDIDALLRSLREEREEAARTPGEAEDEAELKASKCPEAFHRLRQYKLQPEHRKMVVEICKPLTGMPGFGLRSVRVAASHVYRTHVALLNPDAPEWVPSQTYCYQLLHKDMEYSYRRVTGKRVNEAMSAKQKELFDVLIDVMAADIQEHNVLPDFIIGSDEYGQHLFPQNDYTWTKKGKKEALVDVYDDKRQFTGNIVHNALGEVVLWHGIYGGKTMKSLPTPAARAVKGAENFIYGTSPNHWSNVEQKKKLIDAIGEFRTRRLTQLVEAHKITSARARSAKMIILLDCWPVNLSAEIRNYIKTEHDYMLVRYIPAGLTGGVQINDAYLHAPFKGYVRQQAEDWYQEKMIKLLERKKEGLPEAEFMAAMAMILQMGTLRDKSVEWTLSALQKISEPSKDNKDYNLIKKGWFAIYGQIFDEQFQVAAHDRVQLRKQELEAKMSALVADVAEEERETAVHQPIEEPLARKRRGKSKSKEKKKRAPRTGERELTKEEKAAGPAIIAAQKARSLEKLAEAGPAAAEQMDEEEQPMLSKPKASKPAPKARRKNGSSSAAAAAREEPESSSESGDVDGSEDDEPEGEVGKTHLNASAKTAALAPPKPSFEDEAVFAEEAALPWLWTSLVQACAKGVNSPKAQSCLQEFCRSLQMVIDQAGEHELPEKQELYEVHKKLIDKHVQQETLAEFTSVPQFDKAFSEPANEDPTSRRRRRSR